MNPTELAPWDLLGYFSTPKETYFNGPTQGTLLAPQNNQRWGLMFCFGSSGGNSGVSTNQNATFLSGIFFSATNAMLMMNCRDHGPLPTLAWYASGGSGPLTVWEIVVPNWPDDGQDHLVSIARLPAPFPTPAPIKQPGVNNDQGVLSYWRSLMQKIGGK